MSSWIKHFLAVFFYFSCNSLFWQVLQTFFKGKMLLLLHFADETHKQSHIHLYLKISSAWWYQSSDYGDAILILKSHMIFLHAYWIGMPASKREVIQRDNCVGYFDGKKFVAKSSFCLDLLMHVPTAGAASGFIADVRRSFDGATR